MSKKTFMAAIILLTLISTASSLIMVKPACAQPSIENVSTTAYITVQPENIVEGQSINVLVQIYPAPPSANDVFENLTVVLVSPAQGISGYGPWLKGPSSSDTNGRAFFTFEVPTFGGGWIVELFFPGQYFGNNTIYYQRGDWQRNFLVSSAQTPTPSSSPTPSPTPTYLTIDVANGNYMSTVALGHPVYFSAVASNGVPPYRYQWYYRPYYVGTPGGGLYPIGETTEGPASQNFTFIAKSAGHYLITVRAWDSAGAAGYFMSLPPGIWVNAESPTPSQSQSLTLSSIPTSTLSSSITPSPTASPTSSLSTSPTEQPTPTPTQPPYPTNILVGVNPLPLIVGAIIVIIVAAAGLLVYFKRIKKQK
jgi:hypothetical protein